MGSFLTPVMVRTALDVGLIYAIVALSLFISFSILNICDLSTAAAPWAAPLRQS